ncbi:MAG: alpha/beta fold hydrolase [Alphaproteobacteria bacterium]|nr:alpha/beta fold hydrolase [Alphaproteobacteria bacterium]
MRWPPPPDWPMAEVSRQVESAPHRWHVQEQGTGLTILLLHGAGGATQSWRGVFPLLARDFHVVAVDLPGQGFTRTGTRGRHGVAEMAADLIALCRHEGWTPDLIVGHSAGVPIALQMTLDGVQPRCGVVGINAALATFKGAAGLFFPLMAKAMAAVPLTARVFAATTTPGRVKQLLAGTGSVIDAQGQALYARLASDTDHVDGTLAMMAQWDLQRLARRLPAVTSPVLLLTGDSDSAVPPSTSRDAAHRMPNARQHSMGPLGHLAYEEAPERVAGLIADQMR